MLPTVYFQGGTLVINDPDQSHPLPSPFRWIKGHWRCEAHHYGKLRDWFKAQGIRDTVPRWETLALKSYDTREAHDYQQAARLAWDGAGQQGSVVLPTGSGKTFLAIQIIESVQRSTVIVAPTIDLLHQWYARLTHAFQIEIGVYYGGEKLVKPLTVTTYHSAGDLMAEYGNAFKLMIYDEVHHLPAPSWGETALMSPAPLRLGLTATYPEAWEQVDGRWRLDELIGPIVYQLHIDDLAGEQLADYRTERIRIDLTADEQIQYDHDFGIYADFFRTRRLQARFGADWLMEMMRLSAIDQDARRALLARQRIIKLLAGASAKLAALENLLQEYIHEQILIFTENNAVAYQIARLYLIPVITHETSAKERAYTLTAFQEGTYRAIVTSRVLNEGIDVPEAKIAIVLGGTASAREYIQRLGRVLRKRGNRTAILFEIIARNTIEEGKSQRRRQGSKRANQ